MSSTAEQVLVLGNPLTPIASPLAEVEIPQVQGDRLRVCDGAGDVYIDRPMSEGLRFQVGGALGRHRVTVVDGSGATVSQWGLRVECDTAIDDGGAGYGDLLRDLHMTMLATAGGDGLGTVVVNGKMYRYFICWLRDHTHTLKGMKYFSDEIRTGLELYADTQREDGMIYDRIRPKADVQGWRDYSFREGDFVTTLNRGTANTYTLQRIPVENDVEFLFLECLFRTWQATGDTAWMAKHLDHAIKAVQYSTSDQYRWSEKFQLLKRGYTIDTWDFMHEDDCKLTLGDNVCDINKTTFGVMHGDNTGMAAGCRMLGQMLEAAGRDDEARTYYDLCDQLLERLEDVAWDERGYYRHHVTEDASFKRNVGKTDESAQVSLSNAYALSRGIGDDKCRAVIKTYQRIRDKMPEASPGEFYNIYPPFENGFRKQDDVWQYMNAGVSTIVAGELARGAFAQGEDEYAIGILKRLMGLADRHGGRLHVCFSGNPQPNPPRRSFTQLDLSDVATVMSAYREDGGWGDPGNDLSRMPTGQVEYDHVPFRVADGGMGIGIARDRAGFQKEVAVPVGGKHGAMYLLHTASQAASPAAELDVVYADGQRQRVYLAPGRQFDNWFMPGSAERGGGAHAPKLRKGWPDYQIAWQGPNDTFENVGVFVWGWDNPRPDVEIESLIFRATETDSLYYVPGITFSDHPVWFTPSDLSFGIPDGWGAAAVVFALIEGLAGVTDGSIQFDEVEFSPRWAHAGVNEVAAAVTYPASDGYLAYQYQAAADGRSIQVTLTGSGDVARCRIPVPAGTSPGDLKCEVDGRAVEATLAGDPANPMAAFEVSLTGVHRVQVISG